MKYTVRRKFIFRKGRNTLSKKEEGTKKTFIKFILWLLAMYIAFFTTLLEDISQQIEKIDGEESSKVEEQIETTSVPIVPPAPSVPKKKAPELCKKLIKGNISSSGEKIYHAPGGDFYDITVAEEVFCTSVEASAAGYRKSKR